MKLRRSIKRLPRPLSSRLLLLKAKKDPRQMECWLILLLLRRLQSAERPARHFRKRRHCFVFSCTCRSMPFCIRLAGLGTQNLLSGSIAPYRGLQAETHMLIFTCKSYAERMRKSFRHVSPPLCRSPTNGCSLLAFQDRSAEREHHPSLDSHLLSSLGGAEHFSSRPDYLRHEYLVRCEMKSCGKSRLFCSKQKRQSV